MKNLIRLKDCKIEEVKEIYNIADEISKGKYVSYLHGKTVVMFFPNTSIRTRVTFEKEIRNNIKQDKFLFCGSNGNIGRAWKEASEVMEFELEQCCGEGYEIEGLVVYHDIESAIKGKDIICTDSLPASALNDFRKCQITKSIMGKANKGAILNPCPPFYRGEEVSQDVIDSEYFVGYEFKKCLLQVQQAVICYLCGQKL